MSHVPTIEVLRAAAAEIPARTLGAVVYPGFQILDLWGPLEMFGNCAPVIRPLLVAETLEPVASFQGPRAMPDHTLANAPDLDWILVPGGAGVLAELGTGRLAGWIREREPRAELVMSVCNGAAVLAQTGLMDGRCATTNKALYRTVTAANPNVRWVPEARWVRDGKFISSSGVSAGIDMALGVIAEIAGDLFADGLAVHTEYERHPDPSWDPFAAVHGLIGAREEQPE